ncbi:toll/interleukin-1 receptor domain-containing protein [Candidatus Thiothrix anitrata]|uniref:Toll/interleukin-1 receptor domain-containing protein n=1 Tax=Candidatus Thiothrix anitrata TaxID=2823902 RepID=A0ABX7WYZ3_9GAMM|nr:toll/interleukin-1 receptor domain-containing protein [Candidatus Thiothrix anitrata]QTR48954.1 toll/interleukin-1 receptor domain-containing protein [Candidatus Thiothrix anitrata]
MTQPYKIFFSHGGEDTYIVEHFLRPKVEASGAKVFVDSGKIKYGDDFREIILRELKKSHELLILLTKSSLTRPWVLAELGASIITDKRIVAVRYGPSESELQELGILSLLGTKSLMMLDDFDKYLKELECRVGENNHG